MSLNRLTHLFYHSIKAIVAESESSSVSEGRLESRGLQWWRNAIGDVVGVMYALRAAFIVWTMATEYHNAYWHWDYLLCFAHTDTHLYDVLFATAIIFVGIFIRIAKHGLTHSPLPIWQHFHWLVVVNMDLYRESKRSNQQIVLIRARQLRALQVNYETNKSLLSWLMPRRAVHLCLAAMARWTVWRRMDHVRLARMMRQPVILMHETAPLELRVKLVQAVTLIDQVCCLIQIFIYCLFVVYCATYGPSFYRASSWHHLPIIILDQLGVLYIFPVLIRSACIFSVCSFTSNLVYAFQLTRCGQLLRHMIDRSRRRRSTISLATGSFGYAQVDVGAVTVANIEYVYRVHTRICAHVLYGDRKLWSGLMFSFLLTNVPANVYFIIHLLFDKLPLFEQCFYSFLMGLQLVASTFILLRLAKNSKLIHQFHHYIPILQQLLRRPQSVCCKFRLDDLMYRLTTDKYGMTVGPIIVITYESVLQIMFLYAYYLMFAFHIRHQRASLF